MEKNEQTKKIDMRTIRTKKLLAKSLYELLENTPFEKITIQHICDNAMVHRTTYYQHFQNKEELLMYTLDDFREKLFAVTHNNMEHNSPKQMFLHLSTFFIKYVQTNKNVIKKIANNIGGDVLISKISYAYEQNILKLLNRTSHDFTVPKPMISQFFTGGIIKLLLNWLESDNSYTNDELLNFITILMNNFENFID